MFTARLIHTYNGPGSLRPSRTPSESRISSFATLNASLSSKLCSDAPMPSTPTAYMRLFTPAPECGDRSFSLRCLENIPEEDDSSPNAPSSDTPYGEGDLSPYAASDVSTRATSDVHVPSSQSFLSLSGEDFADNLRARLANVTDIRTEEDDHISDSSSDRIRHKLSFERDNCRMELETALPTMSKSYSSGSSSSASEVSSLGQSISTTSVSSRSRKRTRDSDSSSNKRDSSFDTDNGQQQHYLGSIEDQASNDLDSRRARLISRLSGRPEGLNAERFATRTATLRRALSLRSNPTYPDQVQESSTRVELRTLLHNDSAVPSDWVPTAPSTPVLTGVVSRPVQPTRPQKKARTMVIEFDVPIIAPPPNHTWQPALSEEGAAKVRIRRYLEREHKIRKHEGLVNARADWEASLGIGKLLRMKIMEWIVEVVNDLPSSDMGSPSTATSTSCMSSFASDSSTGDATSEAELYDQLTKSPETKFHAAYMFLRYFHFIGIDMKTVTEDAVDMVTWDLAVGSLALSVKIHRDFLWPLLPVHAVDFLCLAPHCIEYGDLESAQRDILSALSHNLGDTPQGILDELWNALPSLRELLDGGWWNVVQKESWTVLFNSVLQPDVLRFPMSLLTAGALVQGIICALLSKYEFEADWIGMAGRKNRKVAARGDQGRMKRAKEEAEGVFLDIQQAMSISDAQLQECLNWIFTLKGR